jgi:hypothetical protein
MYGYRELRDEARAKRERAAHLRRARAFLSLVDDQRLFDKHAAELDADAARLEANASTKEEAPEADQGDR